MPFATTDARSRCESDCIRLTELGAQILPAEDAHNRPMRKVIEELRPVLGPQPFEYFGARMPRAPSARLTELIAALQEGAGVQ